MTEKKTFSADWCAGYEAGIAATSHEGAGKIASLRDELREAKELLKPFGSFTGKDGSDDSIDIIGERGICGNYCVPDSHGFEVIWADENDGQPVHFTAGQFRRVRAFLKDNTDE